MAILLCVSEGLNPKVTEAFISVMMGLENEVTITECPGHEIDELKAIADNYGFVTLIDPNELTKENESNNTTLSFVLKKHLAVAMQTHSPQPHLDELISPDFYDICKEIKFSTEKRNDKPWLNGRSKREIYKRK